MLNSQAYILRHILLFAIALFLQRAHGQIRISEILDSAYTMNSINLTGDNPANLKKKFIHYTIDHGLSNILELDTPVVVELRVHQSDLDLCQEMSKFHKLKNNTSAKTYNDWRQKYFEYLVRIRIESIDPSGINLIMDAGSVNTTNLIDGRFVLLITYSVKFTYEFDENGEPQYVSKEILHP